MGNVKTELFNCSTTERTNERNRITSIPYQKGQNVKEWIKKYSDLFFAEVIDIPLLNMAKKKIDL